MANFKSKETEKAFNAWLAPLEPNYHSLDDDRFYNFIDIYFSEKDSISKEDFVKLAKKQHPTTSIHHKGMYQEYYGKLTTIIQYLNSKSKNHEK